MENLVFHMGFLVEKYLLMKNPQYWKKYKEDEEKMKSFKQNFKSPQASIKRPGPVLRSKWREIIIISTCLDFREFRESRLYGGRKEIVISF